MSQSRAIAGPLSFGLAKGIATPNRGAGPNIAGLYNYNPAYLADWHVGRAAVEAGTRNALASAGPGDSVSAGSGTTKPNSWPAKLADLLTTAGYNSANEGFWTSHGSSIPATLDPNLSIGAGWTFATTSIVFGGRAFGNSTTTNLLSYTPRTDVDTWDIYYLIHSGGGDFTVAFDGGAPVQTVSALGTAAIGMVTVPIALGLSVLNFARVSGNILIVGAIGRNTAVKQNTIINAGHGGAKVSTFTTGALAYSPRPFYRHMAPDISIQCLTINDWNALTDPAAYKAGWQLLIDDGKLSGDVVLMSGVPSNAGAGNASYAQQQAYVDIVKQLAVENNCVMIDLFARWGSDWAVKNALGWYDDDLHPNATGYADIALAVSQLLAA